MLVVIPYLCVEISVLGKAFPKVGRTDQKIDFLVHQTEYIEEYI